MKAYKFTLRQAVYHNGLFSHNFDEYVIVHTEYNEDGARETINLKPYKRYDTNSLVIEVSKQRIAYSQYLGVPIQKTYWEYIK